MNENYPPFWFALLAAIFVGLPLAAVLGLGRLLGWATTGADT